MKEFKVELFEQLASRDSEGYFNCSADAKAGIAATLRLSLDQEKLKAAMAEEKGTKSLCFYVTAGKNDAGQTVFSINEAHLQLRTLSDLYKDADPDDQYCDTPILQFCTDEYWWSDGDDHTLGTEFLKYDFDLFIMTALGLSVGGSAEAKEILSNYMDHEYGLKNVAGVQFADNVDPDMKRLFCRIGCTIYEWAKRSLCPEVIDRIVGGEIKVALFSEDKHGKK